jgi:hypothetical protein
MRHAEALRAGTPLTVGSVTLVPIERVVLQADGGRSGAWFAAGKEPCALIVRDGAGLRAVDTGAAQLPLDLLREQVAGLDAVLAAI